MKRLLCILFILISACLSGFSQSSAGINTLNPRPSAALDITAVRNQGLLIPRLLSSSRLPSNWVLTPQDKGLIFYATDIDSICYYTGSKWLTLATSSGNNTWAISGNNTFLNNKSGLVGIGTVNPQYKLEVIDSSGVAANFVGGKFGITVFKVGSVAGPAIYAQNKSFTLGNYSAEYEGHVYIHDGSFLGIGRQLPQAAIDVRADRLLCIRGFNVSDTIDKATAIYGQRIVTGTAKNSYAVFGTVTGNQPLGTGIRAGVYGEASGSGKINAGVMGKALLTGNVADSNFAIYSDGALMVKGNVTIKGTLNVGGISKPGGTFKIDHPDDPANKYLYHSFVESPDMMNIYNGIVITDKDGLAKAQLPEYFGSLNKDFRYQLTVIGKKTIAYISKEIDKNSFEISSEAPFTKVSWQVTGIRKDAYAEMNRVVDVVDKPEKEKGTYLYPEAYGKTNKPLVK